MAYFELTNLADEKGNITNPASEESIVLLRRIAKILENQQAVDPQQRQRITLDAITASLTLATITTVGTVSAVTAITNALPAGTNTIGNIGTLNGWNQQMFADPARTAYNTGIRNQLTF